MAGKIKKFLKLLEEGKTREEARDESGASNSTSKIQFVKWNKAKESTKEETAKEPQKEESISE